MALGDLFKAKQEREREVSKKRRKAFREAEGAIDNVKERITKLKKERDQAWADARAYLKNGQKGAAQRALQTCRASEMLVGKLDTKRWVFEQLVSKMDMAKTDQDFSAALKGINDVVNIDPEQTADILDAVQDKLGEQIDTDKIWDRVHAKEMDGLELAADSLPSLDDMQKQLEDEVAAEIGEARPVRERKQRATAAPEKDEESDSGSGSVKDGIGEGRRRLKKILGDDK
jgi:hypothetical protein